MLPAPWLYSLCALLCIGPLSFAGESLSEQSDAASLRQPSGKPILATNDLRYFALPEYATDPNEGATYGAIAVVMVVDHETGFTRHIYSPSLTWNSYIGTTGTMRYFYFPDPDKVFFLSGTASARHNWGVIGLYANHPKGSDVWTDDAFLQGRRSIFYQFFGLGNDSLASNLTTFARLKGELWYRRGYSITPELNLGAKVDIQRNFIITDEGAPGEPLITSLFPNAPGLGTGASMLYEGLSLRYDSRENGDQSEHGLFSDLQAGTVQSLGGMEGFNRFGWEGRALFPESSHLVTALRAFWSYGTGSTTPFYYQTSLGGANLLRGFNDDRFIDQGGWEADIEQRILVFDSHFLGVWGNWRVDPFFAIGKVYQNSADFLSGPHPAAGVGFRGWIRPNVTGRIDVAEGGEGLKLYIEMGLPL